MKPARKRYLLFYKPKGIITSHGDPSGRDTIYKYLGEENKWVAPVGRLDKDTSGLLLLTNDTRFADFVTSPDSTVPKTYMVKASGLMSDEVIAQLNAGVEMKRGDFARPVSVSAPRGPRQVHLVGYRVDGREEPRGAPHAGSRGVRSFETGANPHRAVDPGRFAGGHVEGTDPA